MIRFRIVSLYLTLGLLAGFPGASYGMKWPRCVQWLLDFGKAIIKPPRSERAPYEASVVSQSDIYFWVDFPDQLTLDLSHKHTPDLQTAQAIIANRVFGIFTKPSLGAGPAIKFAMMNGAQRFTEILGIRDSQRSPRYGTPRTQEKFFRLHTDLDHKYTFFIPTDDELFSFRSRLIDEARSYALDADVVSSANQVDESLKNTSGIHTLYFSTADHQVIQTSTVLRRNPPLLPYKVILTPPENVGPLLVETAVLWNQALGLNQQGSLNNEGVRRLFLTGLHAYLQAWPIEGGEAEILNALLAGIYYALFNKKLEFFLTLDVAAEAVSLNQNRFVTEFSKKYFP